MSIHISRGGQQYGPYELDYINAGLQSGSLLPTDLAWSNGMAGWLPLAQYPGVQIASRPTPSVPPPPATPSASSTKSAISLDGKLHITLVCAAGIAAVLLFTTFNLPLIGAATGVSWGLSIRLFLSHKKSAFSGTKMLEWMLIAAFSTLALVLMFTGDYLIQAWLLTYVAVRSLILYFQMSSKGVYHV